MITLHDNKIYREKSGFINQGTYLPYDFQEIDDSAYRQVCKSVIPEEVAKKINHISNNSDMGVFVILSTLLGILFNKYNLGENIVIGTPLITNLPNIEPDTIIPLQMQIDQDLSFKDTLLNTKEKLLQSFNDIPTDYLKNEEKVNENKNTLKSIFLLENIQKVENRNIFSVELVFSIKRDGPIYHLIIEYNPTVYKKETINRFHRHFIELSKNILSNITIPISSVQFITPEEFDTILNKFNKETGDISSTTSINTLFTEQVKKYGERIAIVCGEDKITYDALNTKAENLGKALHKSGIKKGNIVAVLMERSTDYLISIMGIIKSGAAYLPLSEKFPIERINQMLTQSHAKLIVVNKKSSFAYNGIIPKINIDEIELENYEQHECNINHAQDLLYVIYTSGSSGKPKGVMMEHKSVCHLINALNEVIYKRLPSKLNVAMVAPFEFDASVQQIFGALLNGNTLHIIPEEIKMDGIKLINYFYKENIHLTDGTPSYLQMVLDSNTRIDLPHLKQFLIAGEALSIQLVKLFFEKFDNHCPFLCNIYGPTETCVDSTYFHVLKENIQDYLSIPIGRPLQNEKLFIMDSKQNIVPIGVPGEIYIGGAGLAKGYMDEDATLEKFILNPEFGRLYRTGDYGKWLEDGNIEYLGRLDNQVKILGNRIELEEIEYCLRKNEKISNAVVIVKENRLKDKSLVAFYTSNEKLSPDFLKEQLAKSLPPYMIPVSFFRLEKFPVNNSGKINRQFLLDYEVNDQKETLVYNDYTIKKLVDIWQDLLGKEKQIHMNSDFFELGGHSLKATILIARIQHELGVKIPLSKVFESSTFKSQLDIIYTLKPTTQSLKHAEAREYYKLSSAQSRLYFIYLLTPDSIEFNITRNFWIKGPLNIDKIEKVVLQLINRHEMLRTSFAQINGQFVQVVHDNIKFKLHKIEPKDLTEKDEDIVKKFIRPFDLSRPPLLRMMLIKKAENRYLLSLDIHHIVADGISIDILIQEIIAMYKEGEIPDVLLQYKDYSEYQHSKDASDILKKQEKYWLKMYSGEIPDQTLPTDFPQIREINNEGDFLNFSLEENLRNSVSKFIQKTNSTIHIFMISVINILLSKILEQNDIIIGVPVAGRMNKGFEKSIGMFVNMLAVRNYPDNAKSFINFYTEVRDNLLNAYENQDYQFDTLVSKLKIDRSSKRYPLFEVSCNTLHSEKWQNEIKTVDGSIFIEPFYYKKNISQYNLNFIISNSGQEIKITIEYSINIFSEKTIRRFACNFVEIIEHVVRDNNILLNEIEISQNTSKESMEIIEEIQNEFDF